MTTKKNNYLRIKLIYIVSIISFLLFQEVDLYGKDIPFIANEQGKIYASHAPLKKIEPLFSGLVKKYPNKEWKVQVKDGYAKQIKITPPLTIGASNPKNFSGEFLDSFSQLLGITPEEASYLVETKLKDEKVLTYLQRLNNIPVYNSHITFVFKDDGLSYLTSRVYPDVKEFLPDIIPNITADNACEISRNDAYKMKKLSSPLECNKGELLILPKEYAKFIKKPREYYLVWKVSVSSTQVLFSYTYFIDALTGELVNKYSNIKN